MKTIALLTAAAVCVAGHTGNAQEVVQFQSMAVSGRAQSGIDVIALDPVEMGDAVLNAPYSADAVTEVTQLLADGNKIEQRTSASIARNGAGRTRRERNGIALGTLVAQSSQPIVTITDPKSGVHITLNYDLKIAFRAKPPRFKWAEPASGGGVVFGEAGVMSSRSTMSAGPGGTFDVRVEGPGAPAAGSFEVLAIPPPPPMPMGPIGPMGPMTTKAAWSGEVHTDALEPKDIEGLRAEGTRTTMVIPAGTMGNAMAIEVINERWYSPELKIVLLTRRYDPRFGETMYRLTNIVRAEPAEDLFKVPADFKIEDMSPGKPMPLRPDGQ